MSDRSLSSSSPIKQIAVAIIYQDNKYLMQLRDNNPNIVHPGVWGLFGGHLELGESPEVGLKRELMEEICYRVPQLAKFHCYEDQNIIRYVFSCPLIVAIDDLELNEGWDMGLLTVPQIQQGYGYSQKADELRPIAAIHRQILLDFITGRNID
jgi:8-oxo-dGTP diphosphatase